MVKCVYCLHYTDGECTSRRGAKFNKCASSLGDIECPAYISRGFACGSGASERRYQALNV